MPASQNRVIFFLSLLLLYVVVVVVVVVVCETIELEGWLLFLRTRVQLLIPTWQLTVVSVSSWRESALSSVLHGLLHT